MELKIEDMVGTYVVFMALWFFIMSVATPVQLLIFIIGMLVVLGIQLWTSYKRKKILGDKLKDLFDSIEVSFEEIKKTANEKTRTTKSKVQDLHPDHS